MPSWPTFLEKTQFFTVQANVCLQLSDTLLCLRSYVGKFSHSINFAAASKIAEGQGEFIN